MPITAEGPVAKLLPGSENLLWSEMSHMHLGPATVIGVGATLSVLTEIGQREAELALGFPYRPAKGDCVLVIGTSKCYVIGVLKGHGKTTLAFSGDVEMHATGRLSLVGGRGIRMTSPHVLVKADRVETVARVTFERVVNSYRWIRGVARTTADRVHTLVKGHVTLRAERIVERADKDVRIDGSRINIG